MATAVQVKFNGHDSGVVGNMTQAFQRIARSLFSEYGDDHYLTVAGPGEYPQLHEAGGVSYFHRVRYEAEARGHETIEVIEHALDAKPGYETAVFHYDLIDEFDPSYLVSRALFTASHTDEEFRGLADEIYSEIDDALSSRKGRRFNETDEAFVRRLRIFQTVFGGPEVIPSEGTAKDILNSLASLAQAKFEEIAWKAFPDAMKAEAGEVVKP